ncbi:MAG TPA: hypothetical protein DDW51_10195 [Cyanobacteria bacterium UBA11367]|nr:hypothetical protein [Cyanobacteria bacterium UBA11367]
MAKRFRFLATFLVTATLLSLTRESAYAGCNSGLGRLDPTCPGRVLGPPRNGGNPPSSVGGDQTPPRVITARNLAQQGYVCYEVSEYPSVVCPVPSGMNPREFPVRRISYQSLGGAAQWSWTCLNNRGQVWGRTNGQLLCQPAMR